MSTPSKREGLLEFQQRLHAKIDTRAAAASELCVPVLSAQDSWLFASSSILKIMLPETIVRVPGAPREVLGVVSLEGSVYTLMDFNLLLGRAPVLRNLKSRIVFLAPGLETGAPVALLVERVLDLMGMPELPHQPCERGHALGARADTAGAVHFIADVASICAGTRAAA